MGFRVGRGFLDRAIAVLQRMGKADPMLRQVIHAAHTISAVLSGEERTVQPLCAARFKVEMRTTHATK